MDKKITKSVEKKGRTSNTRKKVVKMDDNIKELTKLFNIYFFQYMVYSLIFLAIGIVLLTEPALATRTAEIATAVVLIIIGLGNGFIYTLIEKIKLFDFSLVFSAISLVLAALIITNPFALTNFLSVAFGVFLMVNGLLKINYALHFRGIKEDSWVLILTMGIVSIIFGIVNIVNPFASLYFTQVIGLFMVLYSIIEITHSILLKQRSSKFLKQLK